MSAVISGLERAAHVLGTVRAHAERTRQRGAQVTGTEVIAWLDDAIEEALTLPHLPLRAPEPAKRRRRKPVADAAPVDGRGEQDVLVG